MREVTKSSIEWEFSALAAFYSSFGFLFLLSCFLSVMATHSAHMCAYVCVRVCSCVWRNNGSSSGSISTLLRKEKKNNNNNNHRHNNSILYYPSRRETQAGPSRALAGRSTRETTRTIANDHHEKLTAAVEEEGEREGSLFPVRCK